MAALVNLQEIVDCLSMVFDEMKSLVDRETGEVVTVSLDDLRAAEEDDGESAIGEIAEGEGEADPALLIVRNPDRYAWLPSGYEVNAWQTLRDFCITVVSPSRRERLLAAIQGRGAFRHFKNLAGEYGILEEWYAFQERALREIARDWCEENGILYTESAVPRPGAKS